MSERAFCLQATVPTAQSRLQSPSAPVTLPAGIEGPSYGRDREDAGVCGEGVHISDRHYNRGTVGPLNREIRDKLVAEGSAG